ncbi:MAG: cell division protein ZapB [Rhodocyclaceae bacterium]|nr:cell division protein ZapB [Rhodocyclaceae bacterium]
MNAELDGLERKVAQIIDLCASLRAENRRLRERVGALEDEKQALLARMNEARGRLEALLDKLPAE